MTVETRDERVRLLDVLKSMPDPRAPVDPMTLVMAMNENLVALRRIIVALHTLLLIMFAGAALFMLLVVGAMIFAR